MATVEETLPGTVRRRLPRLGHRTLLLLGLVLLAGLAVGGWVVLSGSSAVRYRTVSAQYGSVQQTVDATGTVTPVTQLGLDFGVGGRVRAVLVKAGQRVKAGAPLALLDSSSLVTQVSQAQATLAAAQAKLASDTAAPTPQSVQQARAGITTSAVALGSARSSLADTRAADAQSLAVARETLRQARAGQDQQSVADRQTLQQDEQTLLSDRASLQSAEAALRSALTALADAQAANEPTLAAASLSVQAARQQLGYNSAKLAQDTTQEQILCGAVPPTINSQTSSACLNAVQTLQSDTQTVAKDELALQSAQVASSQAQVQARQSENQARGQVASAQSTAAQARATLAADTAKRASDRRKLATDRAAAVTSARQAVAAASLKMGQDLNQGSGQLRSARVALANARAALVVAKLPTSAAQVAADRVAIATARAQLVAARRALAQATLEAPVGGVVASVALVPGQIVSGAGISPAASASSGGSTAPIVLVNPSALQVVATVTDAQVRQLKPGRFAQVTPTGGTTPLSGTVTSISILSAVTQNVATYSVTIALTGTPASIRPGASVQVRIIIRQAANVLTVPTGALRGAGSQRFVLVLQQGMPRRRALQVGLSDPLRTEIRGGLTAGTPVVLATITGTTGGGNNGEGGFLGGEGGGFGGEGGGFGGGGGHAGGSAGGAG